MKALTRIRAVGGSLVATIPKEIVEEEGLVENELVEIRVEKVRKSGFGLIKGVGKFNKEDELNTEL